MRDLFGNIGVPVLTITNTHEKFAWLVNYLETLLSTCLWQIMTSATIAFEYKKMFTKYAKLTDPENLWFVDWQGHDFSMRGLSSVESAILSGMGHLFSFTGTDVIPAIYQLEKSYSGKGLIGGSVPATEHSVMCMGKKEEEIKTFERLLDLYPSGILSVVSDTWDLWKVCTEYVVKLKDKIKLRGTYTHKDGRVFIPFVHYDENYNVISKGFKDNTDSGIEYGEDWVINNPDITIVPGKLVIRPDSGNPVDIVCGVKNYKWNDKLWSLKEGRERGGDYDYEENGITYLRDKEISEAESKGVIELLWDVFGGTVSSTGYKKLDPHIGAIYGDSITLERGKEICERLMSKGFASTNIVFGIGSYTYQYNTRDTFGFAMKATYGEVIHGTEIEEREIFKDPITDDGTKRSAKGLIKVYEEEKGKTKMKDQCSKTEEAEGLLKTVFKNGKITKRTNLKKIRKRLLSNIK